MLCYDCMEHGEETQAVALCRWCGGAVCRSHALDTRCASEPAALMAPQPTPRRVFVCQRCWEERLRATMLTPSRRVRSVRKREDALPTAAEATQLAEAFLRGEYPSHERQIWPRLRVFGTLLARRFNFTKRAKQEETRAAR